MAMLSASVAFRQKATRDASVSPSICAVLSRQRSTMRPAANESAWPALPGFAPQFSSAAAIARTVSRGLGKLVAALSR